MHIQHSIHSLTWFTSNAILDSIFACLSLTLTLRVLVCVVIFGF